MLNLLISAVFVLTVSGPPEITPLKPKHEKTKWKLIGSGLMAAVPKDGLWVLYLVNRSSCSIRQRAITNGVVFTVMYQNIPSICYWVDPRPVGYYTEDPSNPKAFNLKFYSLAKRRYGR